MPNGESGRTNFPDDGSCRQRHGSLPGGTDGGRRNANELRLMPSPTCRTQRAADVSRGRPPAVCGATNFSPRPLCRRRLHARNRRRLHNAPLYSHRFPQPGKPARSGTKDVSVRPCQNSESGAVRLRAVPEPRRKASRICQPVANGMQFGVFFCTSLHLFFIFILFIEHLLCGS